MKTILFDTETTGLLKPSSVPLNEQPRIIEFYAIAIDENFEPIREFETFINPKVPISEEITNITGISESMVANAPTFIEVLDDISKLFLGAIRLVGHNLQFDKGMLANELRRHEREFMFPWPPENICTVEASTPIKGHRLNLSKLHTIVTGNPHQGAHRAKADVYALVRCYHWLMEKGYVQPSIAD